MFVHCTYFGQKDYRIQRNQSIIVQMAERRSTAECAATAAAPNRPLLLRLIDFVNNCSCHFPPQDNCVCAQISLLTFLSQPFVQALKFDLNKHKSANNTKGQMTVSLILSKTILTLLSPVKVTIVRNFLMCWATEDVEKWTRNLPRTRLSCLKLKFVYRWRQPIYF